MDKYYQLLDANSANVSPLWKVTHVSSMLFATISGFISAYTLGKAIEAFNNHCILFAHIVFLDNTTLPVSGKELPDYFHGINLPETYWGKTSECYFCQFTPVMSMISGLIWGAFFIVCSKGGAGYISDSIYRPWRIVYPAMVFTVIAIGLLLLSTLELSSGIDTFCAQFKDIFNTTGCTNYIDEYTLFFNDTEKPLIIFLRISLVTSIICLVCWISQLITLILRIVCVADFEMFKITVTIPNDSEESLRDIIEPDEISFLDDNVSNVSKISITSKKNYFKHRFLKLSPMSFIKKIYKYKRSRSSISFDQYEMDRDVISLNEPNASLKFGIDSNNSIEETKSLISSGVVSNASYYDNKAKRVGIEKQAEPTFVEDTEKRPKKVERSNESMLSNVSSYSSQIQKNGNILENQIKIDDSGSNQIQQNPLISPEQPNSTNENENFVPIFQRYKQNDNDSSSSTFILDYPSKDSGNKRQSLGFVPLPLSLPNNIPKIELNEQESEVDMEIVYQIQNNGNILETQIKIDDSGSNQIQQDQVISSEQPNSTNEDKKLVRNYPRDNKNENDSSSSTLILDYPSIDNGNKRQSLGFVPLPLSLRNDIPEIKLNEQESEVDMEIVLVEKNEKYNNSSENNTPMNLSHQNNSVPMQLLNYEHRTYSPYNENKDEAIISIVDRISNENFVISRNQAAAIPNHSRIIPVNEEIPETNNSSRSILNYTENVHCDQQVVISPSNEAIDLNNYIRGSNTRLGLTRIEHRADYFHTVPYTLQGSTEENEEIPPLEFREEPRNETNTAQDSRNEIRDMLLRIYVALWLTVVLRNITSLV